MTPKQVENQLRRKLDAARKAAEMALYQAGSIIMTEAKKRTPVDDGFLRNSGYVTLPTRRGGDTFVEAGFGGAAKTYAVKQHEELSYRHEVGEAKYLENAINAKEAEVRERIKRITDRALETGRAPSGGSYPHPRHPDEGGSR
jgi:hypothetical protein